MSISAIYRGLTSVEGLKPEKTEIQPQKSAKQGVSEFDTLLNDNLKLSQHAETRIRSRDIEWDRATQDRIENGIDLAQSKGSREALILTGNVAVIANVESRTVVTAMDQSQLSKGRIFTNIDSTVLV